MILLKEIYFCEEKSPKSIELYHATNEDSVKSMKKSGFMGMDMKDYRKMLSKIAKEHNSPESIITKTLHDWTKHEDPNRSEYHGGVSFFPNYHNANLIAKIYGKMAGEWKGDLIKFFLKNLAKFRKISFNSPEMKKIRKEIYAKYGGSESKPVIVKAKVPIKLISNYRPGAKSELYTQQKVPFHYVEDVYIVK